MKNFVKINFLGKNGHSLGWANCGHTILGPVLYQLWIYNGSANANFFFAITLVFSTAQIFLVTDLLFAHVKREFYLINGYKAIKPNDQGGPQILLQWMKWKWQKKCGIINKVNELKKCSYDG